jgi:hypothetical protein
MNYLLNTMIATKCYILIVGYLSIHDLGDVLEAVWEARSKWYNIGLKLGISAGTLDSISKANNQNPDGCLTAMIKDWLENGRPRSTPSWAAVAKALQSPMVGHAQLAEQLPQQNANTGHSNSSANTGKHSRSYSEGEDMPVAKKNKL